mmetsp:Transcript_37668/g.87071  ORF Transcript_37668/g.87071 Transcript_37668/m.87071 type:complete len:507 (-) Transcript_37668:5169-6689(-)
MNLLEESRVDDVHVVQLVPEPAGLGAGGVNGPLDKCLHVGICLLCCELQITDDRTIPADHRIPNAVDVAEGSREADLHGVAGGIALLFNLPARAGQAEAAGRPGERSDRSDHLTYLIADLGGVQLDSCTKWSNHHIGDNAANGPNGFRGDVHDELGQRAMVVEPGRREVALDVSLHAVVPVRVHHVLRCRGSVASSPLAEDTTCSLSHSARVVLWQLRILRAWVGFQLVFCRHLLVLLIFESFGDLFPQLLILEALGSIGGLLRLEFLQLWHGWWLWPLWRLHLERVGQRQNAATCAGHARSFEDAVEVGHVHRVKDVVAHPHWCGTVRGLGAFLPLPLEDAPLAQVLVENQVFAAVTPEVLQAACLVVTRGTIDALSLGALELINLPARGEGDWRAASFAALVADASPLPPFRELEVESAQHGVLAAPRCKHSHGLSPVLLLLCKLPHIHLCAVGIHAGSQTTDLAALIAVHVLTRIELERRQPFAAQALNRVIRQEEPPFDPVG